MRSHPAKRQSGSTLVTVTTLIAILVAIGASASMLGFTSARSTGRSHTWMRTFYLADSGAQIGNARLRASDWDFSKGATLTEVIDCHEVDERIVQRSRDVYEITSISTIGEESSTVEMLVELIQSSLLDGGIQVNVSNGVELKSDKIPVRFTGTADISGQDHDEAGDKNGGNAVRAITVNPVPGKTGVTVEIDVSATPNVTIEGEPQPISNDASNITGFIDQLGSTARNHADYSVWGSTTFSSNEDGRFGTEASPKTVYVNLGDNETLTLQGNFEGHGTLFVDVGKVNDTPVLTLDGTSRWTGLVVLHFRDTVSLTKRPLVDMVGTTDIVGGLVTSFAGSSVDFGNKGNLIHVVGTAGVRYSSKVVARSPGVEDVVERSVKLTSYRVE